MDEHGRQTSIRKTRYGRHGILCENAPAIAVTTLVNLAIDDFRPLKAYLKAKHPDLWKSGESLENKPAASGTNLEFNRLIAGTNDSAWIDDVALGEARSIEIGIHWDKGRHGRSIAPRCPTYKPEPVSAIGSGCVNAP